MSYFCTLFNHLLSMNATSIYLWPRHTREVPYPTTGEVRGGPKQHILIYNILYL